MRLAGGRVLAVTGEAGAARRDVARVLIADVALFAVAAAAMDWLRFPLRKDELHFWPTVLSFSHGFPPSLEQLRSYDEINTPLPFVLLGLLEHLSHGGVVVARLVTVALSIGCLLVIQLEAGRASRDSALASVGLVLCPYFVGVGTHVYTDAWAVLLILLGMRSHRRGEHLAAGVFLALAVSCRQYAIAFPAGLVLELLARGASPRREWRAWLAPALGFATLGGWFAFFGGLAPHAAIARRVDGHVPLLHLFPDHAAYFVAAIGAYYVVPELILFPEARERLRGALRERPTLLLAVGTALFVGLFPPLHNPAGYTFPEMGFLDKALRWGLGDGGRIATLGALAVLSALRFARVELASLLLLANAGLMLKAAIGWDKYCLPLLAVLWWIRARGGYEFTAAIQR